MRHWIGLLAMGVLATWGCDEKADPVQIFDEDTALTDVNYTDDIAPLMQTYCVSCHAITLSGVNRKGAPLGVDYDTYDASKAAAASGDRRIQAGTMPPSGEVSPEEKRVFHSWITQGLAE